MWTCFIYIQSTIKVFMRVVFFVRYTYYSMNFRHSPCIKTPTLKSGFDVSFCFYPGGVLIGLCSVPSPPPAASWKKENNKYLSVMWIRLLSKSKRYTVLKFGIQTLITAQMETSSTWSRSDDDDFPSWEVYSLRNYTDGCWLDVGLTKCCITATEATHFCIAFEESIVAASMTTDEQRDCSWNKGMLIFGELYLHLSCWKLDEKTDTITVCTRQKGSYSSWLN